MSPRAAWRLEAWGYGPVYDYVVGKADWIAAGLPTEGKGPRPARVLDQIDRDVPTCLPDQRVSDVARRLAESRPTVWVVVNNHRVVLGRLRTERMNPTDDRPVEEVMEPGPSTVRADAPLSETLDRMRRRHVQSLIVTTPDGVLLGLLVDEEAGE